MPTPGPRTQQRPLPGYANPGDEQPDRINRWHRPPPVPKVGQSPTSMYLSTRGSILAPGTVRRLWRQTVDMMPAQAPFSWTDSAPGPGRAYRSPGGLGITVALRYLARSLYVQGGTDSTRFEALHTKIEPRHNAKAVTLQGGNVRNRPTVRNRLTSFGSRVTPLNTKVPAAHE